jgi:hypothetical protein
MSTGSRISRHQILEVTFVVATTLSAGVTGYCPPGDIPDIPPGLPKSYQ